MGLWDWVTTVSNVVDGVLPIVKKIPGVTTVTNIGGGLNPVARYSMMRSQARCAAMGIEADHSSELGLAALATMADAVYDLHDHETVRKEKYLELWGLGWRVVEVERQPNYALEYPKKLAMAVFVKGDLAVLALKGTTKKGASDWHLNLTSIVSGYPPCGPLEEAARLVKKYKDQKKRVMVTGHSLGGYMAEVVATNLEISGVGFCAPGSGWHAGKPHSGFQNINFLHDVAGNVAAAIYRHPQWSVYVEDSGPLPCHSMAYMVMCMENPERKGWTNQNVVSNCKSEPTSGAGGATGALIKIAGIASGFYTNCNTAGRPASPV